MIFQGARADLLAASVPDVLIDCSDPEHAHSLLAGELPGRLEGRSLRLSGLGEQATARVVVSLVNAGIGVYGVRRDEQTLEDVFMDLTKDGGL
ncbi:hypothetical protein ABZ897_25950 [Nonomuraea sp. NPDC046802]|uniref:hypothetical protein n=1 Tax=Nonomuraea sp. NPDC046802 TaxID=3154919 RepID=UPI0033EEB9C9